jgi:hypothetical protein
MSIHRVKVDKDGLHELCLRSYEKFASDYLTFRHVSGSQKCPIIVDFNGNDAFEFEVKATVELPKFAGQLCMEYARAAQTNLSYMTPDRIIGAEKMTSFPKATFCLFSLLQASYPRNPKTGIFKRNIGPILVLDMQDELVTPSGNDGKEGNVAFCGIGVTLLRGFRSAICPTLSDAEAIEAADGYYVAIPT